MRKTCVHGIADMELFFSWTFHGDLDLIGPWEINGETGRLGSSNIRDLCSLPQVFTLFCFLKSFMEDEKKVA